MSRLDSGNGLWVFLSVHLVEHKKNALMYFNKLLCTYVELFFSFHLHSLSFLRFVCLVLSL